MESGILAFQVALPYGRASDTEGQNKNDQSRDWSFFLLNGGADGTRTRDLRRDRPAF